MLCVNWVRVQLNSFEAHFIRFRSKINGRVRKTNIYCGVIDCKWKFHFKFEFFMFFNAPKLRNLSLRRKGNFNESIICSCRTASHWLRTWNRKKMRISTRHDFSSCIKLDTKYKRFKCPQWKWHTSSAREWKFNGNKFLPFSFFLALAARISSVIHP